MNWAKRLAEIVRGLGRHYDEQGSQLLDVERRYPAALLGGQSGEKRGGEWTREQLAAIDEFARERAMSSQTLTIGGVNDDTGTTSDAGRNQQGHKGVAKTWRRPSGTTAE